MENFFNFKEAFPDDKTSRENLNGLTARKIKIQTRIEQFIITHHKDLYEHHRNWMEKLLTHGERIARKDN